MMHHLIISSDCCKYMEELQMVLSLSSSKDALTHVVSQVCRVNCHQYLPCQCRPSRKRRTTSHRYLSIVGHGCHGFSSQRNIRNQKELYIHLIYIYYLIWPGCFESRHCCLRHSSPNGIVECCGHVVKMTSRPESGLFWEKVPTFFWTKRQPKVQPNQWYVRAGLKEWETEKWWLFFFQTLTNSRHFRSFSEKSETSRNASPSSRE